MKSRLLTALSIFTAAIGTFVLGVILSTGVARAEPEPNDTMGTAVSIGVGTQGIRDAALNPAGDRDYYRFSGVAGRTYTVEVFNVTTNIGYTNLYVYNSAGTRVASADYYCNGSGNVCSRATVEVSTSGTYYFLINADSSSGAGTYSTRVLPRYDQGLVQDAAAEPNDVFELATQIGIGRERALDQTIYARDSRFTTGRADQDTFRFAALAGRTYTVEVFNVTTSTGHTNLYVYNSAGTRVASADYYCNGSGNVCNRVVIDTPIGGTHFFTVVPDNGNASGTYSVRVLPRYDQGHTWDTGGEPNDALALAYPLTLGVAQAHTLYPEDSRFVVGSSDNDYFRIATQAGRQYVLEVRDRSAGLGYTNLYVYNSAGTRVASADYYCNGTGTICNRIVLDVSISGNYFLRVNPDSGASSGLYTICAYASTSPGCQANALMNPSFDTDANRDGRPDAWTSAGHFTRNAEVAPRQGTYVGRFYATDNSNVSVAGTIGNPPPGKRYTFSGWVNIPASSDAFTFKMEVRWRDAANRVISTQTIKTYTGATSGWNQASGTVTAPADTNNAQVVLSATSLGRKIYVDDFLFRAAP